MFLIRHNSAQYIVHRIQISRTIFNTTGLAFKHNMKFAAALLVLAFAQKVFGNPVVHVSTTDTMVDVGDLDLFKETWQAIYAAAGNQHAITSHTENVVVQVKPCNIDKSHTRQITITIEGAWDDVNGRHHEIRDAMVEAAWKTIQDFSAKKEYNVWRNCCRNTIGSVCSQRGCDGGCGCAEDGNEAIRCDDLHHGHHVPAILNVSVEKHGELSGNRLRIAFSSQAAEELGGCHVATGIVKDLAGFVFPPVVGALVGVGIDLSCA
ncbi:hypothetical protein D7B24_004452 [Verticillium nonalfalfae]|uniref:Uncharacterized protein n=1 Tax=Verticillium nonalfalfae TaxID=1051616 RepID=A0A3M9YFB0_9PEZI|nr:uncharacterized protein D7B24_004452 [Verticillium nonalfalfae]RNJ58582.1 hypothetical protein D7B24_004452 [Verticillium nonalfalfae]